MQYLEKEKKWQMDRHIPIIVLLGIFLQTCVWIWWLASFTAKTEIRISALEQQEQILVDFPSRMSAVETQLNFTNATLKDIRDDLREKNDITRRNGR
jgi:hypothetical protein